MVVRPARTCPPLTKLHARKFLSRKSPSRDVKTTAPFVLQPPRRAGVWQVRWGPVTRRAFRPIPLRRYLPLFSWNRNVATCV